MEKKKLIEDSKLEILESRTSIDVPTEPQQTQRVRVVHLLEASKEDWDDDWWWFSTKQSIIRESNQKLACNSQF